MSPESLREVRELARENTRIYEDTFAPLPSDRVRSWDDLEAHRRAGQPGGSPSLGDSPPGPSGGSPPGGSPPRVGSWSNLHPHTGDVTRTPTREQASEALSQVRGHLVEFPLDFLADEDLAPPAFSVGALTPDAFD